MFPQGKYLIIYSRSTHWNLTQSYNNYEDYRNLEKEYSSADFAGITNVKNMHVCLLARTYIAK